jgi:hypothetical protein
MPASVADDPRCRTIRNAPPQQTGWRVAAATHDVAVTSHMIGNLRASLPHLTEIFGRVEPFNLLELSL